MRGIPPFGYRHRQGVLVEDEVEQEVITLIMEMRHRKPPLSYGNIAAYLNRREILNRGKFWNPTTLWYIYKRELKGGK